MKLRLLSQFRVVLTLNRIVHLLFYIVIIQPAIADEKLYQQIEWPDLIPDADLHTLNNPPDNLNQIADGDFADQISSALSAAKNQKTPQTAYEKALVSTNIRAEFDQRLVRIPGFIVPLQFGEQRRVTEFFLVPFFGACMHMPAPPPNQVLYAKSLKGVELETLMDAFWIDGKLSTTAVTNDMATAAYSLRVDSISPYYDD